MTDEQPDDRPKYSDKARSTGTSIDVSEMLDDQTRWLDKRLREMKDCVEEVRFLLKEFLNEKIKK